MSVRACCSLLLPWLRRLVVGIVLLYTSVSLTLGGTRHARLVFQVAAASWLLVVGAGCWLAARKPSVAPAGFRQRLELVLSNIAFTLLLAELTLRAVASVSGSSLLISSTLDAHRLRPHHDYGAGLVGNSLGYPGPDRSPVKPPGVRRIVAVGDSFAVGPAVPFADNFLTVLEKRLPGVEVCNLGVSGAGPREYYAVLQRDGWSLQPDLVLVCVFVGNDITEWLPAPRAMDPRQHAVFLLLQRGWRLLQESRRAAAGPPRPVADRLAAPPLSEAAFREIEARRLAVCLRTPSQALAKKWQKALGYLDRIVQECQRREVAVAVALIPDEFQVNPRVLEAALRDAGVQRASVDLDLPQRRLSRFCEERGVPCLDLREAAEAEGYAPQDTHWNVRGNRAAAARLVEWLWPRLAKQQTLAHPSGG